MIQAQLRQGQRCPVHLQKRATERCDRCYVFYCGDCLEECDGRKLCARCSSEEAQLVRIRDEARLTPRNVLRRVLRRELAIALVVIALLAVGLVAFVAYFWRNASQEVDYLLIRRVRAGFTQTFTLGDEGYDFAEILNEGKVRISSQSQDPIHSSERLIDGLPDHQIPSWRSGSAVFPIELLFIRRSALPMAKLVLWNHPDEDPLSFIKDFEVWTSPVDPAVDPSKLALVGRFTADKVLTVQRFEFNPPVPTLFTLVRINSNHGSDQYISAAEIGLFAPNAASSAPATRTPTRSP